MREPVDTTKPMGTRDDLWKLIRAMKTFTVPELREAVHMDATTIDLYVRSLVKAGYLERIDISGGAAKEIGRTRYRYTLLKDALEAPRIRKDGSPVTQGRGRLNMWRSMKVLKRFGLADIVACSSTEEHPVAWEEAETYLRYLLKAGYLKQLTKTSVEKAVYALVRWTGPKAPMIQRIRQVWDPNLKKVTWRTAQDDIRGETR